MSPRLPLLLCLPLLFQSIVGVAQITALANSTVRYNTLVSLEQAGPKLFVHGGSGFDLVEPDMTPFLSCAYPPAHVGRVYLSNPGYITEALFDNDPSTIEYIIRTYGPATGNYGCLIARTDGTVLFEDTTYGLGGIASTSVITNSPPIIDTPDGPILLLVNDNGSRTYSLPGSLPCPRCSDEGTSGMMDSDGRANQLQIRPNPTGDQVTITGLDARPNDALNVYDAAGSLVRTIVPLDGRFEFSTDAMAAGSYRLVMIDASGTVRGTGQLIRTP